MAPAKPRHVNPFDPQALLEAQRRNFEAFTSAGEIVVDGMRAYAERQAAMVQETMAGLWGELRAGAAKGPPGVAAAAPGEQVERIRAAFDKVVAQVQELSNLLIKVQGEALAVLNACAVRNLETLGATAPDFSDLQARARAAFETANRETTAVVDEMRRRMATLESRADGAAADSAPAAEPAPSRPAAPEREAATSEAAERPAPEKASPPKKQPPAPKAAAAPSGEKKPRKPAAAKEPAAPAAPRARRGGRSGGAKAST